MTLLDWKERWRNNARLIPSKQEDKQLPFLINALRDNIDISKVETVLEVGIGYGRIAKVLFDLFPNLQRYHGVDISWNAIRQSIEELRKVWKWSPDVKSVYSWDTIDFEEFESDRYYDLVISVETMSCIPEYIDIQPWIDKMCLLSKEYVVNLDYIQTLNTLHSNKHDYFTAYNMVNLKSVTEISYTRNESLFIYRVL